MAPSFHLFKQLGIVLLIDFAGECLHYLAGIPVPGSILGMVILLGLLKAKILREHHVADLADFLLAHINFFFIPVGVGILVSYKYLEGHYTAGITLILVTTVIVMLVSGWVTEILVRRRERRVATRTGMQNDKKPIAR